MAIPKLSLLMMTERGGDFMTSNPLGTLSESNAASEISSTCTCARKTPPSVSRSFVILKATEIRGCRNQGYLQGMVIGVI